MKKTFLETVKKYQHAPGNTCLTCQCPYLEDIRAARKAGGSCHAIARALTIDFNYKITGSAIAQHFRNHEEPTS